MGRHKYVLQAFVELGRTNSSLDAACVAAIETLDAELAPDRGQLIRQYVENADTAGNLADRLWTAAYETSQAFIHAYRQAVEEAVTHAAHPPWRRLLPRLFARLIHFYGTDAKLRVLRGERWIPAKWVELHGLYQRACALGIARTPLRAAHAADGAPRTVEQEYVSVLLTHLLNTGTLTASEIDWAGAQIRAWTRGLSLDDAPHAAGGFCVDIAGRSGLMRRDGNERGASLRYLDTSRLAEQMQFTIVTSRARGDDHDPLDIKTLQRVNTLGKLQPALMPDVHFANAREPRVRVSAAADVRIGLARILQVRAFDQGDEDVLGPASVLTGGRGANRPTDYAGLAEHADAAVVNVGESAWRIEDRSSQGMRLRSSFQGAHGVGLGTLIAVHDPADSGWIVAIVRRLNRSVNDVEAGVAIIARDACVVPLNVKSKSRAEMSIVVDGVDASTIGTRFEALYLPPPSRPDAPAGAKTLIVPTTEFAAGRQLILVTRQAVYTLALGKAIEQRAEYTWAAMEIVERTERSAETI